MKKKISPSLMCADFLNLGAELKKLEKGGIEYLHVDIMDGEFVQNYTLGTDFVKKLHAATDIPLDIHLMVVKPELKLDWFELREGDYVSVHYEAATHLQALLAKIHQKGAKTMLAISPGTPISVMEEVLPDLDAVLVMTVNPGFAGQKLVPQTIDKIRRLRAWLDEKGYPEIEIEVDGNVNYPNARLMSEAGANIFVAGTSSLYAKGTDLDEEIAKFRDTINLK